MTMNEGYEPSYTTRESDLIGTGADEQDDFDPELAEWEGVTSETIGGPDEPGEDLPPEGQSTV